VRDAEAARDSDRVRELIELMRAEKIPLDEELTAIALRSQTDGVPIPTPSERSCRSAVVRGASVSSRCAADASRWFAATRSGRTRRTERGVPRRRW